MDVAKNNETKRVFESYLMRRKNKVKMKRKKVKIHSYKKFDQ